MNKMMALLSLALFTTSAASAATWPVYENTHRDMGQVTELYSTTVDGQPWVAFVVTHPDGSPTRLDCGTRATILGCILVELGDYVLVSSHSEQYGSGTSCRWDGADFVLVPNVIYNCSAWRASGGLLPCLLMTP